MNILLRGFDSALNKLTFKILPDNRFMFRFHQPLVLRSQERSHQEFWTELWVCCVQDVAEGASHLLVKLCSKCMSTIIWIGDILLKKFQNSLGEKFCIQLT